MKIRRNIREIINIISNKNHQTLSSAYTCIPAIVIENTKFKILKADRNPPYENNPENQTPIGMVSQSDKLTSIIFL